MIKEKQSKPSFEVVKGKEVTTMNVRDFDGSNLEFNAERVGLVSYFQLREAKFGPEGAGFKAPTFGELAPLIYSALENRDTEEAKRVVQALRCWMIGKTLALTGKEGLLIDDNPDLELVKGNRRDYEISLKNRLGKKQERSIVYSDDGLVRFVPYGFSYEEQSSSDFADNEGLIALVGNPERAKILGKVSENYKLNSWLGRALDKIDSPQLRVPGVDVGGFFDGRLDVSGDGPYYGGFSFGVRKSA